MKIPRIVWLLLAGLLVGTAAGLAYTRWANPARAAGIPPAALNAQARDAYRLQIAAAYAADGDPARAAARLAVLRDSDPLRALAAQAQRLVAEGGAADDARQLALLAAALRSYVPTSGTPPADQSTK
ncbi:MAG TPA: hypothetical protein VF813_12610 [Anaerolineaceae bacterium]